MLPYFASSQLGNTYRVPQFPKTWPYLDGIMSSRILAAASLVLLCLLAGCATPYQPKNFLQGGYQDFHISQDTFSVTFQGNPYLDRSRLRQYLLRRAAELTLGCGFSHFAIIQDMDQSRNSTYISFTSLTITVTPQETIVIRCFKGAPADLSVHAIDAQEYLRLNFPTR